MQAKQDTALNCISFIDENTLYIKLLTLNTCRTENNRSVNTQNAHQICSGLRWTRTRL